MHSRVNYIAIIGLAILLSGCYVEGAIEPKDNACFITRSMFSFKNKYRMETCVSKIKCADDEYFIVDERDDYIWIGCLPPNTKFTYKLNS